MKKIGNFFKAIWANKNSILAIITSVASILLATYVVLKGYIIDSDWEVLNFFKDITPAVEAVEAINIGDILVPEIPAVYEVISEAIPAVYDELGALVSEAIPAVYGELISEAIPAVIAGEADVVVGVEACEAIVNGLNVYGYIVLGIISCGVVVLDVYGIINHYGWEGVDQFAARMQVKKNEAEERLATIKQKAEYKEKLSIFNKGLKEINDKINDLSKRTVELKTLIDSKLATAEQVMSYNNINSEIASLSVLKENYNNKIAEIKGK